MLALLVASRVDEKNQKRRARVRLEIPPSNSSVARDAGQRFHRGAVGDPTGSLLSSLMEGRTILQIRPGSFRRGDTRKGHVNSKDDRAGSDSMAEKGPAGSIRFA